MQATESAFSACIQVLNADCKWFPISELNSQIQPILQDFPQLPPPTAYPLPFFQTPSVSSLTDLSDRPTPGLHSYFAWV